MRDKLVKLLRQVSAKCQTQGGVTWFDFADHLLANGVTVQEWISVEDRLPEENGRYLTANKRWCDKIGVLDLWFDGVFWCIDEDDDVFAFKVTHWMPLPQPPKGE